MTEVVVESERLSLRRFRPDDRDRLLELFGDPVAMRYFPSTRTAEETDAWIERCRTAYSSHGFGLWAAMRRSDACFLGYVGLIPQQVDGRPELEIGYGLVRRHWGQGYATEGATAVREFGFCKLERERLISIIDPNNRPSIAVALRVGMTFEKSSVMWEKPVQIYAIRR